MQTEQVQFSHLRILPITKGPTVTTQLHHKSHLLPTNNELQD